jgi:hypothetical protein
MTLDLDAIEARQARALDIARSDQRPGIHHGTIEVLGEDVLEMVSEIRRLRAALKEACVAIRGTALSDRARAEALLETAATLRALVE